MSIITLTTDFGIEDEYAGVMKGVILGIHPSTTIVDITHHIQPHDLIEAAYTIETSYKYFPSGTLNRRNLSVFSSVIFSIPCFLANGTN